MKKTIKKSIVILSVTNDLISDQRLHKVAWSLFGAGYAPKLVGLKYSFSQKIGKRNYKTERLPMFFRKGPLFYTEFNIKLFFYLLFSKATILVANDLDTILSNYLAFKLKHIFLNKIRLVYDSHELYTELPELNNRPLTRKIWLAIEKWILPKIKNAYTVCQPIADYYAEKYKVKMQVIKNMPLLAELDNQKDVIELKIPKEKKIILYQGALNIGRGIEQVIDIMPFINNAIFVIAGNGTIENELKQRVIDKQLSDKVLFLGKLPFEKLNELTKMADLGLVLQNDLSLSYRYVLPNRLFDFIKAGIPIIASDLPEVRKIIETEGIGLLINGFRDQELLEKVNQLLNNNIIIGNIKEALNDCKSKYCWEMEEKTLIRIYSNL